MPREGHVTTGACVADAEPTTEAAGGPLSTAPASLRMLQATALVFLFVWSVAYTIFIPDSWGLARQLGRTTTESGYMVSVFVGPISLLGTVAAWRYLDQRRNPLQPGPGASLAEETAEPPGALQHGPEPATQRDVYSRIMVVMGGVVVFQVAGALLCLAEHWWIELN